MSAQHAMMVGGNSNPVSQVNSPRFPIEDVSNANQSTTDLQDRVPTYGPWGRDVVVPSINRQFTLFQALDLHFNVLGTRWGRLDDFFRKIEAVGWENGGWGHARGAK